MPETPNLESANNGGFLWPSIADAVDTFVRRRLTGAEPYERLWRLIHVWEATEITLAVASVAHVAETAPSSDLFRRLREFFYGQSWDQIARSFRVTQGAADGSIDQWISILEEVAKAESLTGQFLPALRSFLESDGIDLTPLATQWGRACDVPSDLKKGLFKVRHAMRHVNSLRNRLAHVPFPHDPLGDLADALEAATEQLFGISPSPGSHEKDEKSSPLTGSFRAGRSYWHGTQFQAVPDEVESPLKFAFPCKRRLAGVELWSAHNFIHVDAMMRPHLLTRVKGLDVCEYTRFKAEASAISVREATGISGKVPRPSQAEYKTGEEVMPLEEASAPVAIATMSDAIEAIRSEDYERALAFFEQLVVKRPDYHIGWLRLGHIRREKGVRLIGIDNEAAVCFLRAAISDLEKATDHRDPDYQALARYELSKAYYHLARLLPDDISLRLQSKDEALAASSLSNEQKYQSWWEHIEQYAPWNRSTNVTPSTVVG
jgi:tetratricopeptide (TPR) repeat protein